jgi:hypothetical protein
MSGISALDANCVARDELNGPQETDDEELGCTLLDEELGCTLLDEELGCTLLDEELGCTLLDEELGCTLLDEDSPGEKSKLEEDEDGSTFSRENTVFSDDLFLPILMF